MLDTKSDFDVAQDLAPAARSASANGGGVDLAGYDSALIVVNPGAITDGTHTPKVQESDDDATYTDVAAGDLVGALAAIADNTVQRVGYIGTKRYVRVAVTVAGATTGGVYGTAVVRGHAKKLPLA